MPETPNPLDLDEIRAVLDRGVAATGGEWFHALRSCIGEVERLRAEVARLEKDLSDRTMDLAEANHPDRPAPAWDEEAVVAAVFERSHEPPFEDSEEGMQEAKRFVRSLAVVSEHLPIKPGREDIYRAWHGTDEPWGGCADSARIERVLALWPGRSEAEVRAEAAVKPDREAMAWAMQCTDYGEDCYFATEEDYDDAVEPYRRYADAVIDLLLGRSEADHA